MTRTKEDKLMSHPLDGKKVMITRGKYRYSAGRVLRNQAFLARGRLTLTIRNINRWSRHQTMFATPAQVQVL